MGSLVAVIAVLAGVVIAVLLIVIYVQWKRYTANYHYIGHKISLHIN